MNSTVTKPQKREQKYLRTLLNNDFVNAKILFTSKKICRAFNPNRCWFSATPHAEMFSWPALTSVYAFIAVKRSHKPVDLCIFARLFKPCLKQIDFKVGKCL